MFKTGGALIDAEIRLHPSPPRCTPAPPAPRPGPAARVHDVASRPHAARGVREIPLDEIRGTLEPSRANQFDGCFAPVRASARRRWERVWIAEEKGVMLPPISVVRSGTGTPCGTGITACRSPAPAARSRSTPPSARTDRTVAAC